MAIVITEAERKKAFGLYDQGESPNRVAVLLFKGHWYKAKRLHDEYGKQAAGALREHVSRPPEVPEQEVEEVAEVEPVAEAQPASPAPPDSVDEEDGGELETEPEPELDTETWDVTLQLPAEGMDQIMARFTPQEKANAICAVLQGRLNAEAVR